ncbi:hypothetical protein IFM89_035037 [Coptis chinensis]|uniref:Chalcone-flavonone isomerase family protein n=1 Tax=Coptis chinensis TaxID=261450 RepID=A0A835H8Y5_9MAGN|nr:hypothetical protein IFM89_035037 [Coptis chinensis]
MHAGPFEKIVLVKMISQLMGQQYAMGLTESCIRFWKTLGNYTESKDKGLLEELIQVFQDEVFPPNSTILFTQSSPTLTIGFSEDGSIPKEGKANIENKRLSEAILGSAICKGGVSPATRRSLAVRLCDLFKVEEQKAAKC